MKATSPTISIECFILMLLITLSLLAIPAHGQQTGRPQWLTKGETYMNGQRSNNTYYFKIVQNIGADISSLRSGNANALADHIGKHNHVQGLEIVESENTQTEDGGVSTRDHYQMAFRNDFSSEVFYATLVDEYWELDGSRYNYYALFAVSESGQSEPMLDRFEVSRSYGAAPAVMSIIPGVGQLYKGQKLKGGLMLAGAAACVGTLIWTENNRSYYETRIIEQPKFARDWSKKRDNFTTYRNITIGATGALVVWSILDAAITPGNTRIRIKPYGLGASVAYNF